jgi:hypothetical protein
MAAMRLSTFKATVASASKTLGSTTVSFYFWHLFAPIIKNKIPELKIRQGKMQGPARIVCTDGCVRQSIRIAIITFKKKL